MFINRSWRMAVLVGLAAAMGGCCMCWLTGKHDNDGDDLKKDISVKTPATAAAPKVSEWAPLFNGKNLDGFYTFLQRSGKNIDPEGIFKVENGMIHIMDIPQTTAAQEPGYLCTNAEYGDYDLRFEYKWGAGKFAPRADMPRDSGCHYLLTGPDKAWANALECQVQEGETGDMYLLNNAYQAKTTVKSLTDRIKAFEPASGGGVAWAATGSRIERSQTLDSLTDWNKVEVIVDGNSSTHIVNGQTVLHVTDITRRADGTPITRGRIAFQEEAAEIYLRNIDIKLLK